MGWREMTSQMTKFQLFLGKQLGILFRYLIFNSKWFTRFCSQLAGMFRTMNIHLNFMQIPPCCITILFHPALCRGKLWILVERAGAKKKETCAGKSGFVCLFIFHLFSFFFSPSPKAIFPLRETHQLVSSFSHHDQGLGLRGACNQTKVCALD